MLGRISLDPCYPPTLEKAPKGQARSPGVPSPDKSELAGVWGCRPGHKPHGRERGKKYVPLSC